MATRKKESKRTSDVSAGSGLLDVIESIVKTQGGKEARSFRPVPTGIDVLDYYNARFFQNHSTKEWELFMGMPQGKLILKIGYTGSGKSQPIDSPVYTPNGVKKIGDLDIGETICTPNGKTARVDGIFPQGKIDTYIVKFSDGSSTKCGFDHNWEVIDVSSGKHTMTTGDLLSEMAAGREFTIPLTKPVGFNTLSWEIPPQLAGTIFAFMLNDDEEGWFLHRHEFIESLTPPNNVIREFLIRSSDEFFKHLKEHKTLPIGAKFMPVHHRTVFIKSVCDELGGTWEDKFFSIIWKDKELVKDFIWMIQSLGGIAKFDESDNLIFLTEFSPFNEHAKAEIIARDFVSGMGSSAQYEFMRRKIVDIIKLEDPTEQVCIHINDGEHLYLTDDFIVTHNTTLAVQDAMAMVAPYEDGIVYHIDLENAWSIERTADITGLDMETVKRKYKRMQPMPLETIYAVIKRVISAKEEMMADPNSPVWVDDVRTGERVPVPTIFIIDTVTALQSKQLLEENTEMGSLLYESGSQAKANNALAQRLAGTIGDPNITILAINHIRIDPGSPGAPKAKRVQYLNVDETCPGGTGFPQFSDYFLKMVPSESLTNKIDEGFAIPGKIIRCTVVKSRLSYDGRQFELVLTANGFSNAWSNLQFLRANKYLSGAGAHLFLKDSSGRETQKFSMRNWENLYEGNQEFRDIADAVLSEALMSIVPEPGAVAAPDAIAIGTDEIIDPSTIQ